MLCVHAAIALGKNDNLIQKHSQGHEGSSDNGKIMSKKEESDSEYQIVDHTVKISLKYSAE